MPLYGYVCSAGHETELFFHLRDDRPDVTKCASCGRPAKRVVSVPNVIGDIPEHFNASLGEVVRGRTHLRELQRVHGCQDYEPSGAMREKLKYSRAKALRNIGRGPITVGG